MLLLSTVEMHLGTMLIIKIRFLVLSVHYGGMVLWYINAPLSATDICS